jgi:hypothetical protein
VSPAGYTTMPPPLAPPPLRRERGALGLQVAALSDQCWSRGGEEWHGARQDRGSAEWVAATLDGAARHQIYMTPEQPRKLLRHQCVVEQSPVRARLKGDEYIDVAVWPEIVTQDRAKQFQARHPSVRTERFDLPFVEHDP